MDLEEASGDRALALEDQASALEDLDLALEDRASAFRLQRGLSAVLRQERCCRRAMATDILILIIRRTRTIRIINFFKKHPGRMFFNFLKDK